jgi:hypothetical protein
LTARPCPVSKLDRELKDSASHTSIRALLKKLVLATMVLDG